MIDIRPTLTLKASAPHASALARATALAGCLLLAGCSDTLDAGSNRPHGRLPVDDRSPVILVNDGAFDNWNAEYAMLLANGGRSKLAAIVVNSSLAWSDITANVLGFRAIVVAARESGLQGIPEPTTSISSALSKPASGKIEDTRPNRSEGAWLIVDLSSKLALPYRPVVIATGGSLTDVADAYLLDPSVAERIVVISSLGLLDSTGATMALPNGDIDPWADTIVATRLRYVQVSAFYDQVADVPESRLSELPANAFGDWMRQKQPQISKLQLASDQVALLAASLPGFVSGVQGASVRLPAAATDPPRLVADDSGTALLVNHCVGALASARLWELLLAPSTFSH
jgi:hypothetical protein